MSDWSVNLYIFYAQAHSPKREIGTGWPPPGIGSLPIVRTLLTHTCQGVNQEKSTPESTIVSELGGGHEYSVTTLTIQSGTSTDCIVMRPDGARGEIVWVDQSSCRHWLRIQLPLSSPLHSFGGLTTYTSESVPCMSSVGFYLNLLLHMIDACAEYMS